MTTIERLDYVSWQDHVWLVLKIWWGMPTEEWAVLSRRITDEDVTFADAPVSELQKVEQEATP